VGGREAIRKERFPPAVKYQNVDFSGRPVMFDLAVSSGNEVRFEDV
jgi:hypothetical protein